MRVGLRPLGEADIAQVQRGIRDAEAEKWLSSVPWPYRLNDTAQVLLRLARGCDQAITVDGEFAGVIRCVGEPGYWVLPEFRRQGVATQAMVIVLQDRFAEGAQSIEAAHHAGNTASRRMLLRLGFVDCDQDRPDSAPGDDAGPRSMVLTPEAFAESEGLRHAAGFRIATLRTVMDQLAPEDMPALHAILTDPDNARMLMRFHPGQSVGDIAELLAGDIDTASRPLRLAVRIAGRCVGTIGVGDGDEPAIFYSLARDVTGRGIASEIVPAFCAAVRHRFGLEVLRAEVFRDNPASRRVLEKAGFREIRLGMLTSVARDLPEVGWVMQLG